MANFQIFKTEFIDQFSKVSHLAYTFGCVQLEAEINKSDADNLSTLLGENVTRGALKNLVTDKPAPITVKLAQKSDGDNLSVLFDHNVTRGALKNLVTDKPSPITVKLA